MELKSSISVSVGAVNLFATNADLWRHQRRENTQLSCDICSKVFKDKASLKGHTDTHNDMKRHTCGCGKAFR